MINIRTYNNDKPASSYNNTERTVNVRTKQTNTTISMREFEVVRKQHQPLFFFSLVFSNVSSSCFTSSSSASDSNASASKSIVLDLVAKLMGIAPRLRNEV